MKISVVFFIVFVTILASALANPAKGTNKKKPCLKECGEDYKPVCGGDGTGKGNKSFGNKCVLENYNCEQGLHWTVQSQGECPGGGGVRLQ